MTPTSPPIDTDSLSVRSRFFSAIFTLKIETPPMFGNLTLLPTNFLIQCDSSSKAK